MDAQVAKKETPADNTRNIQSGTKKSSKPINSGTAEKMDETREEKQSSKPIKSGTAEKMDEAREDLPEEIDDEGTQSRQEEDVMTRPRLTSRKSIGRRSPKTGT